MGFCPRYESWSIRALAITRRTQGKIRSSELLGCEAQRRQVAVARPLVCVVIIRGESRLYDEAEKLADNLDD